MKKLFFLFLIVGLAAASCNKPENDTPQTQDVIFKANATSLGLKSSLVCDNNAIAQYASIEIEYPADTFTNHTVEVFYLDGTMYYTLKLDVGEYVVHSFILKNDNGTPDNLNDDISVYATPMYDADYSSFVEASLPISFSTNAFLKNEVNINVLCYNPTDFELFGFSWFQIDRITVREFNFFGDFCTKYYAQYIGNDFYAEQAPLSHDMIAIFQIEVFANGVSVATYNNETTSLDGEPLKVQYPDYVDEIDNFDFVLSILVKDGDNFNYKVFHTWSTVDAGNLPNIGTDGVMDFVLGSCVPDADLVLAPYMNLPATATLYTQTGVPGDFGTYFDITLSDIATGFDIQNGEYGAYCADNETYITLNQTYTNMNVFSSLYADLVPASFDLQKEKLDNINWLGNNLYRYENYDFRDVQNAVWMMLGQITEGENGGLLVPTSKSISMKVDALEYGNDYLPPVGGYAAVLFISPNATSTFRDLQLLFTLVDP